MAIREDDEFRRWIVERRLLESRLERTASRLLLIAVAITFVFTFVYVHKYCIDTSKSRLSSLSV